MTQPLKFAFERWERFLRITPEMRSDHKLRARIIYTCFAIYLALLVINVVFFAVRVDTSALRVSVLLGLAAIIMTGMLLPRWTLSSSIFGVFCTVVALWPVLSAASTSAAAQTSMVFGGGLSTPTLPILCLGAGMVAVIGAKWTIGLYLVTSIALLLHLGGMTNRAVGSPEVTFITELKIVQMSLILMFIAGITHALSTLFIRSLRYSEKMARRAKKAEKARSDFLAKMSHEIRTPLHGILGLSDMLSRMGLPDQGARHAELISKSASNLMDIINEVLDMAKLEDGSVEITAQPFSPHELLQDIADLFAAKATGKSLWIGADVDVNIPETLIGDAPHLRQVLSNLVGNAVKFTKEGGVRVGARLASLQDEVAHVQFYVQDSGVGIAESDHKDVFERFKQSESASSSLTKGTGLGLSICRELTEKMGGELKLQSSPGQGSVFYFMLSLLLETAETQEIVAA